MNWIKNTANILFLVILTTCFSLQAHADIVYLDNGNTIEGETRVDEEAGTIIVTIPGAGDLILGKHEVIKIEEAPVVAVPTFRIPEDTASWIEQSKEALRIPSEVMQSQDWNITPEQVQALRSWAEEYQQSLSPIRWFVELAILLIAHIIFALCLFVIARRTETAHAWMAWVPLLTPFLVFWVVKWKVRWFFLAWVVTWILMFTPAAMLVMIVPVIMLITYVRWWIRLAQVRYKSGWLGLPMAVPFLGLPVMAYVAFSGPKPKSMSKQTIRTIKLSG